MKKIILTLPVILFTAACAERAPITTAPVQVKTNAAFNQAAVKGIDATEIRSVRLNSSGGVAGEIKGAQCNAEGTGYTASFSTPAVVRLPHYGRQTPTMTLTCTADEETITQSQDIANKSAEQRGKSAQASGAGFGLVGAVVGAAAAAAVSGDRAGDVYGYNSINVRFPTK